jgi:TorA maturation chaperone TorD
MDRASEKDIGRRRATVYLLLAEALAPDGPPEWMAEEGRKWPLYEAASSLAILSTSANRTMFALEGIPDQPLVRLKNSFSKLFTRTLRPYSDLYESTWISGRPMGPEMIQVERLYRAAGLEMDGSELADHAAMELAFLAHLAGVDERELERNFIRKHAGRWLPFLGKRLSLSRLPGVRNHRILLDGLAGGGCQPPY